MDAEQADVWWPVDAMIGVPDTHPPAIRTCRERPGLARRIHVERVAYVDHHICRDDGQDLLARIGSRAVKVIEILDISVEWRRRDRPDVDHTGTLRACPRFA